MGDLYSFGIERDVLSEKLGGGLPRGSLMTIKGGSSSGKSITCQRICFGLLENGVSVTYISTQLTTKNFIAQMQTLDYPIGIHLIRGKLLMIPVIPLLQKAKQKSDYIQRLMAAKTLFRNDVVIIDTISSLLFHSADVKKTLDLINFLKKIGSVGKTVVLALDDGMLDPEVAHLFESSSDIHLEIETKREMNNLRRSIAVRKFAGSESKVTQIIGFLIEYWCPTHQVEDQRLRILYYDMKNEAQYKG